MGDIFNASGHYYPTPPPTLPPYHFDIHPPEHQEDLSTMGVFISSTLLSLGGCLSIIFAHLRRSNCSVIDFGCCKIQRENLNINDDVLV